MTSYQDKQQEIKDFCLERLKEIADYKGTSDFKDMDIGDLHHEIFNTDYCIIGRYQAKQWMGEHAFDMIGDVQEYENMHFGEIHTDLSEPEQVLNMWIYVEGWQIIDECYQEVYDSLDDQVKLELS